MNRYPEKMANMNAKNYFRFKDPNPVADHGDEMISVMQSNRVDTSG